MGFAGGAGFAVGAANFVDASGAFGSVAAGVAAAVSAAVLGPGTRPLAARDRALPPRGVRMVSFLIMSRVTAPDAADALINIGSIWIE